MPGDAMSMLEGRGAANGSKRRPPVAKSGRLNRQTTLMASKVALMMSAVCICYSLTAAFEVRVGLRSEKSL